MSKFGYPCGCKEPVPEGYVTRKPDPAVYTKMAVAHAKLCMKSNTKAAAKAEEE